MISNPSPFIEKLEEILNDPQNSDVISYNEPYKRLQISNRKKFEQILPKYFRHGKFQSFVRQLNWYGFYKINMKGFSFYSHPDLHKGMKLSSIKSRRKSLTSKKIQQQNKPFLCFEDKEDNMLPFQTKNHQFQYIFQLQNPWVYNNPCNIYFYPEIPRPCSVNLLNQSHINNLVFSFTSQQFK